MNRVRRLAMQLIDQFPGKFSSDYEANKKFLTEHAIFRSKLLRNEVAGYITRHFRLLEEEEKTPEPAATEAEEKGAAPTS